MYFDKSGLQKLSTKRLLTIYRLTRASLRCHDPEWPYSDADYNYIREEEEYLDECKRILDTREHIPRRPRKAAALPKKKRT